VADPFFPQPLVDDGDGQLDRNSYMVADDRGRRAGSPRRPSITTKSAPARTIPEEMGATLWTAAILIPTGFR